jgi:outer membrane protein OmpA-like peptidoglycan-associated protein
MVASDDHLDPWRAYGDAGLTKSPVSREQATNAIAAAKAQVDAAFLIGQEEAVARDSVSADPPVRVHFAFNSSALNADATAAVTAAAAYLNYRPETVLDVSGHTDPIGSDDANDTLGQARADAVLAGLTARGVARDRVHANTMGEHALVTRDPKRYNENRRADFGWATGSHNGGGGAEPSDAERATTRAMTRAQERADPALVLRFVPRPVEERAQGSVPGGNAELPDWHWGRLDASFRGKVDDWIRGAVGAKLESALDGVPQLACRPTSAPTPAALHATP